MDLIKEFDQKIALSVCNALCIELGAGNGPSGKYLLQSICQSCSELSEVREP
jgi:hypothetical protein